MRSVRRSSGLTSTRSKQPSDQSASGATVFIEQPLDRAIALDPAATDGLRAISRLCPLVIDESDGELGAFPQAIALGYRGVSSKNCKGIVKAFLNRALVEGRNRGRPEAEWLFMSAEDLTNVPVVALQQDLATVRALGLGHVVVGLLFRLLIQVADDEGDLVGILKSGSYSLTASPVLFLGRPTPAEVVRHRGRTLIGRRRYTILDFN